MPNSQTRLQLATKIHFFLLRELDHGIDIQKMLTSERYARDVLLVCQACRGTELAMLAEQFQRAMPHVAPVQVEPDTQPGALPAQAPPPTSGLGWLTRWIHR